MENQLAEAISHSDSTAPMEDPLAGPPVNVLNETEPEPEPERPLLVNVLGTLGYATMPFTTRALLDGKFGDDTVDTVLCLVGDFLWGGISYFDITQAQGNPVASLGIRAFQLAAMSPRIGEFIDQI